MKALRRRILRRINGLSVVLVPALWLLLWQAWPPGVTAQAVARSVSPMRVRYTPQADENGRDLMPLLFLHSTAGGPEMLPEDSPDLMKLSRAAGTARLLERPAAPAGEWDPWCGAARAQPGAVAGFRPAAPAASLFQDRDGLKRELVIEVSPSLQRRGFRLPGLEAGTLGNTNTGWQVTLDVECGAAGRIESVFVESGTADRVFNSAVARTVHSLGIVEPGAGCSGRVTVSYGEE